MIVAVTAETMAVTTEIVQRDIGAGSDRGACPVGRAEAPRGCGALALAATSAEVEASAGENVDSAGATTGLGVLSATAACGEAKPRDA